MSRARDMANLGAQAGSGFDASDLTTGTLGNTVQDNITRLGTVTTGTFNSTLGTSATVPASVGGVMVYLEKFTASNTNTKEFNLTSYSTYNHYKLIINGIESSLDGYNMRAWLYQAGTGWMDSSGDYRTSALKSYFNGSLGGTPNTANTDSSFFIVQAVGDDATYGVNGEIDIFHPRNSSVSTACTYRMNSYANDSYVYTTLGSSFRLNAEDNTHIKFNFGTSDMESGTITLYGIKDA